MRVLLILCLLVSQLSFAQNTILSGFVKEKGSQEQLAGVNVHISGTQAGTASNAYGFFSIQLPKGQEVEIVFSFVGYHKAVHRITSQKDLVLDIELVPKEQELDVLSVTAEVSPGENYLGHVQLPVEMVKQMPALLGEKDVIKILQLLPSVQRGTEGSTALYVRGGGPGQNLILLDDAQVYNASHLFGFFSTFNGDAIKSVDFWKGAFPARYGGRISSVIDIKMKDGNKEKLAGEGGIGLLSSRLTLEGPIQKGKSSFLVSGRRSYLDLLTKPFMSDDFVTAYRFYDLNLKLNLDHDPKNKFFISGYFGNDKFLNQEEVSRAQSTINAKTDLGWGNSTSSLRWNHIYNNKLFSNTTLLYSYYKFYLNDDFSRSGTNPENLYSSFKSSVTDYALKTDFDYYWSNTHSLKFGATAVHHTYKPRSYASRSDSDSNEESVQQYNNQELGAYLEDTWQPLSKLSVNAGLRLNALISPQQHYILAEPRLMAEYEVFWRIKVQGAYARVNQFVHLLSNTGMGLSTDLWVPATEQAPPEQADQVSIGASKSFKGSGGLSLSVESYRRYLRNIVAYTEGANFLVISEGASEVNWEDNITIGKGLAYGTEVLLRKSRGKLNGWIGYTLSWTIHQFDELNYGKRFYPRQDSRHNISIVGTYELSPKVKLSASWVYGTGNALTVPKAYYYGNYGVQVYARPVMSPDGAIFRFESEQIARVPYYGSRNSFRAEAYHRLDLAVQVHKQKEKWERYWEFGLFNAYSRKNPFYYYLEATNTYDQNHKPTGQKIELKKKSLFPVLPSISYNFKF
ncbi:TonB-dependent receptor plug [Flammeovirgaceae bacterium 311]|nr:TonB-dependent receptor plug [Flammeovirgaceae bacterium 311]